MLDWVENRVIWLRDWNIELTFDFEKAQGCGGEVNKTSIMQKQPSEVFFKKGFMRNLAEFTKKASVPETLFR